MTTTSQHEDPFEVLGLDMTASDKDVASAFRRKSLSCHPDRHPDDPTARARFDRLSRAKESLLDPESRKAWEHFRRHGTWPEQAESLQPKGKGKGPAPGEWVDRGGFRARAPDERKRMENERIQRGGEEAFQRYQAQRRAEAQKHIKASTGGRLGTAGGQHVGMEEARRAFAERLEREIDPKVKRQQRAQEEKRKLEEEKKEREEAQRQRDLQWREREQQQIAKSRQINEAKRRHWQGWHSHPTTGPSTDSKDAGVHMPLSPMVGKWLYGKKPNEYCISEEEGETLHFSGPDPDSDGRLCGVLLLNGEWHEVELMSARGQPFGRMRFLYVSNDEGEDGLISQFQKVGRSDWGREIFARRDVLTTTAGPRLQGEGRGSASSSCSGTAQEECGMAMDEPAVLSVRIIVDRDLDISTEVDIRRGSTVQELKEHLMADTPVGSDALEEFALGLVSSGDSEEVQLLPETLELTESNITLELISISPELAGPEQRHEESSVSEQPADEAQSADKPQQGPPKLLEWLQDHRLDVYHEGMLANRYQILDDLCKAEPGELDELVALLEMKPGHAMRFRKAIRESVATIRSHSPASHEITAEQLPEPDAFEKPTDVAQAADVPEQGPPSKLLVWLQDHRLEVYNEGMLANCYQTSDDLCKAEPGELDELVALLEMKPGHAMRFRKAIREHVATIGSNSPASQKITAEQPPEPDALKKPTDVAPAADEPEQATPPVITSEQSLEAAASEQPSHGERDTVAIDEPEQYPKSDLLVWLQGHRLDVYHEAMVANRYESLDDLCNAESGRHEELIALLEMKPGHAMRFRRALREGSKAQRV